MCGIAGAVGFVDERVTGAVTRMHGAQKHRGPDDDGVWQDVDGGQRGAVFAHRRLSVLDLSPLGHQPMVHATGPVLCFNGEVYNFRELRAELERSGAVFKGSGDTEVILEAYAQWGERFVERLRGMFALALWDPARRETLLVRDRLGIKPLYWAQVQGQGTLVFASELRALLASGLVPRRVCPEGLQTFVWNGVLAGPRTIVKDVSLLPEGSVAWVGRDGVLHGERRYWSMPRAMQGDAARAVDDLSRVLRETVAQHVVSDVPLGVFLSGGIDSSSLAALACEVSGGGSAAVRTFNVSFDEAQYDESQHAAAVAKALGTDHVEVRVTESSFQAGLEEALRAIDQPTFDGINTFLVSKAVREAGITVALAGTGGDELFGGYTSFHDVPQARRAAQVAGRLPARQRGWLAKAVSRVANGRAGELRPQTRWGKLEDVFGAGAGASENGGEGLYESYQVSYSLFTRAFQRELVHAVDERTDWGLPHDRAASLRAAIEGAPDLHAISTLELSCFLGDRLLRDTDVASMAVSLEVRVPLLDHVFIEHLARVPIERRFMPLRRKQLLRDLALSKLPASLFERPKRGFELPLGVWIRRKLRREIEHTLTDVVLAHRIGLNGEAVARAWRAYRDGAPGIYWSRVWALYVLMRFCRVHELELA